MKNKIGRKTLVISIVAIVAFSMIGLAAVNNFLSNEAKADVTITAKTMDVHFSATAPPNAPYAWVESVTLAATHGGDTISVWLREHNNNPYAIDGYLHVELSCDAGFAWNSTKTEILDFKSISFHHTSWDYTINSDDYDRINDNTILITYPVTPSYTAGFLQIGEMRATFEDGAHGTYTLTAQVLPN